MKINKKLFVQTPIIVAITLLGTVSSVALAQTTVTPPITNQSQLAAFLCSIINWFFWIIIIISVIMVLVAAFDYITAGDDTEKTTRGRKRLTYAAVGIAIALLAVGFPQIVASVFPGSAVNGALSCSGSSASASTSGTSGTSSAGGSGGSYDSGD